MVGVTCLTDPAGVARCHPRTPWWRRTTRRIPRRTLGAAAARAGEGSFYPRGAMASQRHVTVGSVQVGGGAPVVVQTMTKTETANLAATMDQIRRVADAGA